MEEAQDDMEELFSDEEEEGEDDEDTDIMDIIVNGVRRHPWAPPPAAGFSELVSDEEEGEGGASDEESSALRFTEDEEEEMDTTAEQVERGRDPQGIPWHRLHFSRNHYRRTRLHNYRNYVNLLPEEPAEYRPGIIERCRQVEPADFYSFVRNNRGVQTNIIHFQLRNLVWATSSNDVYVVHDNAVNHWNPFTRRLSEVLNLGGGPRLATIGIGGVEAVREPGLGRVQVSTLCVREDLVAAGGFGGELVVKRLGEEKLAYAGRITASENGITNGIEIYASPLHGECIMASNNDCAVRVFQAATMRLTSTWLLDWAVNYATIRPDGHLVAVVGDDPRTVLIDERTSTQVMKLEGHEDYSFAVAWHPDGNLLATGNQDTSTLVWDVRSTQQPLARLAATMAAVRSLRFSSCGRFLVAAEPADFVHITSVASIHDPEAVQVQQIELFGDVAGIALTPLGDRLYIGIADTTYSSLIEYNLMTPEQRAKREHLAAATAPVAATQALQDLVTPPAIAEPDEGLVEVAAY